MAESVSGHFLWLRLDGQQPAPAVKVYFGEAAEPDDPSLLDRFVGLEAFSIPGGRGEPLPLSLQKQDDALHAELPRGTAPSAVILSHKYGVITRQGETFFLNYYAKTYPAPLPGTWRPVNLSDRLPLEINAEFAGKNSIDFHVTWQGKPATSATITIAGPGIHVSEGVCDENGTYRGELQEPGVYSIRARFIENAAGQHDGKEYRSIRHYSTLTLPYSPALLASTTDAFPDLTKPTTSFGGAIAGDALYVYGGNYGDAHEYSSEGQSGDLWKLDLKSPAKWEQVMSGPKLQGLAMVEHQGALYRIGGFTALNKANEEQNIQSQTEFARLDLAKSTWESLPALPEPRSSHDAALLGEELFVVGGWDLQGGQNQKWHATALKFNLGDRQQQWTPIASPPFKRRAVAVAAWHGKIYCIGGMQEKGGPTTAVAIYDPASDSWSEGPALLGNGMEGFGTSAFAAKGDLYVTTMSGSIQRLSPDGKQWNYVGQLAHPRFFHRLLPWQDRFVVVGGAHMSVGKIESVESIALE